MNERRGVKETDDFDEVGIDMAVPVLF